MRESGLGFQVNARSSLGVGYAPPHPARISSPFLNPKEKP